MTKHVRATVAVIVSVGLLASASGCSMLAGRPTRGTRVADAGLIAASLASPLVFCQVDKAMPYGGGGCELPAAAIGIPVLFAFGIAAGMSGNGQETDTVAPPVLTLATADALPGLPTDETTLRLAKQMRTAAIAGQCGAVERTMPKIAARDARYHAELAKADFVVSCRE